MQHWTPALIPSVSLRNSGWSRPMGREVSSPSVFACARATDRLPVWLLSFVNPSTLFPNSDHPLNKPYNETFSLPPFSGKPPDAPATSSPVLNPRHATSPPRSSARVWSECFHLPYARGRRSCILLVLCERKGGERGRAEKGGEGRGESVSMSG